MRYGTGKKTKCGPGFQVGSRLTLDKLFKLYTFVQILNTDHIYSWNKWDDACGAASHTIWHYSLAPVHQTNLPPSLSWLFSMIHISKLQGVVRKSLLVWPHNDTSVNWHLETTFAPETGPELLPLPPAPPSLLGDMGIACVPVSQQPPVLIQGPRTARLGARWINTTCPGIPNITAETFRAHQHPPLLA